MKLFFSPNSPYVRKVLVTAHEMGLDQQLQFVDCAAHPVNRDARIIAHNPLGKVPTLVTPEGLALYDSRVICEYLNAQGGGSLFPAHGPHRWQALAWQALAFGLFRFFDAVKFGPVACSTRPCWSGMKTTPVPRPSAGPTGLLDKWTRFTPA